MKISEEVKSASDNFISEYDVFFAYRFFLGRQPEGDFIYDHWIKKQINVASFLNEITASKEFRTNDILKKNLSIKKKPKGFDIDSGIGDRYLIVSGCQGETIECLIAAMLGITSVSRIFLRIEDVIDRSASWFYRNKDLIESADKIIVQRKSIKDSLVLNGIDPDNIFFIPLVECFNQHPDICYIINKESGENLLSPMGEYHSIIIFLSYLHGLSISDTKKLFNSDVYAALGFKEIAQNSIEKLKMSAVEMNFDIQDFIRKWDDAGEAWMWSVNHPKKKTIVDLLAFLFQEKNIPFNLSAANFVDDPMLKGPCWPLYASVIPVMERDFLFKLPSQFVVGGGVNFIDLHQMIEASFLSYNGLSVDDLIVAAPSYDLDLNDFIFRFKKIILTFF